MTDPEFNLDLLRAERVGLDEALFCAGKTPDQISRIVETVVTAGGRMLLTRLDESRHAALSSAVRAVLDYDPLSGSAVFGDRRPPRAVARVAVVCAGTSDLRVSREATRTLEYYGERVTESMTSGSRACTGSCRASSTFALTRLSSRWPAWMQHSSA